VLKAFGQKAEDVENGGFATAVGPDQNCDGRDIPQFHRLQGAIVFNAKILNAGRDWTG
jgi:hypothetical protein